MTPRLCNLIGVVVIGSLGVAGHVPVRAAGSEVSMVEVTGDGAKYWSRWRGPSGQGIAAPGKYREVWSAAEGVKWKTKVPGSTSENEGAK